MSNKITFEEVSQTEIDEVMKNLEIRFYHLLAIPGTHRVHYVLDKYVVQYADLSCEQSVRLIHWFHY